MDQLTNGTDYTIVYTTPGSCPSSTREHDDLSVIWVEYEADLMPVKEWAACPFSTCCRLTTSRHLGSKLVGSN